MPSSVLMIAIGSPLTNALGIAGSVGSHNDTSHLPVLFCGGAELAPGVSQRSTGPGPGAGAAADAAGVVPDVVDHTARAASSLACAALRSEISRSSSVF